MTYRKTLLLLVTLVNSFMVQAQDMSSYRWQNRLVLVLTDDPSNTNFQEQLKVFSTDSSGMAERKLMIISSTTEEVKREFPSPWTEPRKASSVYDKFHKDGAFEIILIGLDGGVKLRKSEILSLKSLYRIIDSMPMRASEMRKNHE